MTQVGFGPLWRIDGPPPLAPVRGLLQAAAAGPTPLRINPTADLVDAAQVERWLNGVEVFPYPVDTAAVWDTCAAGSDKVDKEFGSPLPHPQFGAFTVYLAESCTSRGVWDQDEYKARAVMALAAVEGAAVEREFLTGGVMVLNPHLTDGQGTFPNGNTATNVVEALALLENEIAASGRQGVIHCSPAFAIAARQHFELDDKNNVVRTINGTVVIPGFGYAAGATPMLHPDATGTQEWVYATGPIDIRRSTQITVLPERVEEALERGTGGASTGRPNTITYRAERYYLIDWDTAVQAAVLADRCQTAC